MAGHRGRAALGAPQRPDRPFHIELRRGHSPGHTGLEPLYRRGRLLRLAVFRTPERVSAACPPTVLASPAGFDVDEREQDAVKYFLVGLQPDAAFDAVVMGFFWSTRDVDWNEGFYESDEVVHFRTPGAAISFVDACAVKADDWELACVMNFRLLGHAVGFRVNILTSHV